jgi:hypothetical protein
MEMYIAGMTGGMFNNGQTGDGILPTGRVIGNRSTGKAVPVNREPSDTVNITQIETGLQVQGLPETGQEAAVEVVAEEGKLTPIKMGVTGQTGKICEFFAIRRKPISYRIASHR